MVAKPYTWAEGATLEDHSRRKHKVVRQYLARYLAVRCQHVQQTKFRLAIVDGFAGGGVYNCGSPGSPVIWIEELCAASIAFNLRRADEGMAPLDIECLLVFNDYDPAAVAHLQSHVEPLLAEIRENAPRLSVEVEYRQQEFEHVYPEIREFLLYNGYRNVLFNLDQCGHSSIDFATIADAMSSFSSCEAFYTFSINSLVAFLHKSDPAALNARLNPLGVDAKNVSKLDAVMNNQAWLGTAERMVFEAFKRCAKFVSPFSINNPEGWRYWLVHFANSHRARQEYNDVLHDNSSAQAHFGRSGLHMLSYDPTHEGNLYLFDMSGRDRAKDQLHADIPRLVAECGDAIGVNEFYESIFNETPAHTDDIHRVMIENTDLHVVTERGGDRASPNTIKTTDRLRLKRQRSFTFALPPRKGK